MRRFSLHPWFAATAITLSAVPCAAAPVVASVRASATAVVAKPLSILRQADLDFGSIGVAGAGTVVIDPVTSAISTTGPLTILGSGAHPASFVTTGSRNSVVLIRIPTSPITLTQVGGSQTMTASNWTLNGPSNRKYPVTEAFTFNLGATLNVASGQADGDYVGTFAVTVQYP